MKINADYREFTCLDDIINDLTDTIAGWSPEKIKDAVEYGMHSYINDWYYDYDLTAEEEKAVEEMAIDYFTEEDEFTSNLYRRRKEAGLTQTELAKAAGVHITIISRIERGERSASKMSLDTAARLAAALNCHADDLLDYDLIIEDIGNDVKISYETIPCSAYTYSFNNQQVFTNSFSGQDLIEAIRSNIESDILGRFCGASEAAQNNAILYISHKFSTLINNK